MLGLLFSIQLAECQESHVLRQPLPSNRNFGTSSLPTRDIPVYPAKIINTYPHDTQAFTQGLVYDEGFIYESTGIQGASALSKINPVTGEVVQTHKLQDRFFGEGITICEDKIIQLTWRSRTGFVYDKGNFKELRTFHYATEGWGITHDGESLIVSDGTAYLYFLDPETFKEMRRMKVTANNRPVTNLNELEYVHGDIYANVWHSDYIAIIDSKTGRVKGWINLEKLSYLSGGDRNVKVLNGIAYDGQNNRLFVTGKFWPDMYEIKLASPSPNPYR
jgi:glutamine cyclotransferase